MKRFLIALLITATVFGVASCGSDKPSKAEFKAALKKPLSDPKYTGGITYKQDDIDDFADCFADRTYDDLSPKATKVWLGLGSINNSVEANKAAKKAGVYKEIQTALIKATPCFNKLSGASLPLPTAVKINAKTDLSNAIISVKAWQTGEGITDFVGLTSTILTDQDPDYEYTSTPLGKEDSKKGALLVSTPNQVVLQTRGKNGDCYFAEINSESATRYGSARVEETETCPTQPNGDTGAAFTTAQADGWAIP